MDIERIRQLAREQGVDLAVHGLVCLPRELKKYIGYISKRQRKDCAMVYVAIIQHRDFYLSKTFNTEADADKYIHDTNVREGFLIKNRFTVFEDRVEVELPGGKTFICDLDDLGIVELHTWYCKSNGYVVTNISGVNNKQFFHNMVMNHVPSAVTVDHINRNGLDNHRANLRVVNKKIQSINRGRQVNNKTGIIGVCYDKHSKSWIASWKDASGTNWNKYFSTNKHGDAEAQAMAIKHRQRMIQSLPHYREALQLDAEA